MNSQQTARVMEMERTLVLVKPDAIQRGLVGEVISRFEKKGLKIVGMKMMRLDDRLLKEHYAHIADKPFFKSISTFMQKSPIVAIVLEGVDSVETVRRIAGITKSREAEVGTIRGDLAMSVQTNVVHATDSRASATVEVTRFFRTEEIFNYELVLAPFLYSPDELMI